LYHVGDDHFLHFATPERLGRLKKSDLMRLYTIAGLADDPELFTKHELIESLILAREDDAFFASFVVDPSLSLVDRSGESSSGSLTNDGNIAGGKETDEATNGYKGLNGTLPRRVTLQDFGTLIDRDTIGVSHRCIKNSVEEPNRRR